MRFARLSLRSHFCHRDRSRDRGVGIADIIFIVAGLSVIVSAALFSNAKNKGQNPITGGAQDTLRLSVCLDSFEKHKAELVEDFPPGVTIPQDNADYKAIIDCKNDVTRILTQSAEAAQNPQWAGLLNDLNKPIADVGTCTFKITSAKSKPAGQPGLLSVGLSATIPLENLAVVGNVAATTGETGKVTRNGPKSLSFEGSILLDGSDKTVVTPVTLTLTPSAPVQGGCPAAVFTWGEPSSYTVTLDPPPDGTTVSDDTILIFGKIVPKPPNGTVAVRVNGKLATKTSTDGAGNFSGFVQLTNVATLSDLTLTNPGRSIVQCGPAASAIFLRNNKNPLALSNIIGVTVEGEGKTSNTAALVIKHVVRVEQIDINWPSGSCPGPHESVPAGQVLAGTESKQLGTVKCGILCPGIGTQCEATARVDIVTSVGSTYTEADWHIDITE